MAKKPIAKARLLLNAVGCVCIIAFSLLVFFAAMRHPAGLMHPAIDPDRGKGAVVSIFGLGFFLVLGLMALLSLIRTVRKWRE